MTTSIIPAWPGPRHAPRPSVRKPESPTSPGKIRFNTGTLQGYRLESFADAFRRYMPSDPEHRNNPQNSAENEPIRSGTSLKNVPDEIDEIPQNSATCSGVPDENPKNPETEASIGVDDAEYDDIEREAIMNEADFGTDNPPPKAQWEV